MSLIPNVPPKLFSMSAIVVGYLLIDDTTANEQNALGNWLMLVAQILCTNTFYKQVQQERGNDLNSNYNNTGQTLNEMIIMLEKMLEALKYEINDLKNK